MMREDYLELVEWEDLKKKFQPQSDDGGNSGAKPNEKYAWQKIAQAEIKKPPT